MDMFGAVVLLTFLTRKQLIAYIQFTSILTRNEQYLNAHACLQDMGHEIRDQIHLRMSLFCKLYSSSF